MDRAGWLALLASFGAFGVVGAVVVPFAMLTGTEIAGYYGVTPVGPTFLSLVCAVAAVGLASAAAGRSNRDSIAGLGVVSGLLVLGLAAWWAVAAGDVVGGLAVSALFDVHRWVLLGTAVLHAVGAVGFAAIER